MRRLTKEQGLMKYVTVGDPEECWLWTAGLTARGYGKCLDTIYGRIAHRVLYQMIHGVLDSAIELHHTCKVKRCCNPLHLVPLTQKEHAKEHPLTPLFAAKVAQTHCLRGHPFDATNTYRTSKGGRMCLQCKNDKRRSLSFTRLGRPRNS